MMSSHQEESDRCSAGADQITIVSSSRRIFAIVMASSESIAALALPKFGGDEGVVLDQMVDPGRTALLRRGGAVGHGRITDGNR